MLTRGTSVHESDHTKILCLILSNLGIFKTSVTQTTNREGREVCVLLPCSKCNFQTCKFWNSDKTESSFLWTLGIIYGGVFPLNDFLEDIGSLIRISLPSGLKSFPHGDSNAQSQAKLTVKPISARTMAPGEFAKFYETTLLFDGIS